MLVKLPDPPPSKVLVERWMPGPGLLLQQTPLAVTGAPPSLLMLPPDKADVADRLEGLIVLKTASVLVDWVLKKNSFP